MQRSGNRTLGALGAMARILCACALIFAGLAHRAPAAVPPSVSPQSGIDLSAFAMPDGTLPVICRSSSVPDNRSGTIVFVDDCEFCRLAGAAILPTRECFRAPLPAATRIAMPPTSGARVFLFRNAGAPTRGPPVT